MTKPIIVAPEATADVREVYTDLQATRAGLGDRFTAQLAEVLGRIEATPELYGVLWQDVRVARLRRLRYLVYYVVHPDRVDVLAVLHGSRDDSTWQSRV